MLYSTKKNGHFLVVGTILALIVVFQFEHNIFSSNKSDKNKKIEHLNTTLEFNSIQKAFKSKDRHFIHAENHTNYYSSPFKIIAIEEGPFGGKIVRLYFVNQFNALFDVWLYKINNNGFQIRSITKVEMAKETFETTKAEIISNSSKKPCPITQPYFHIFTTTSLLTTLFKHANSLFLSTN